MIRVFLADDHPMIRQGVRRLLEEQLDITVVGEAGNGWDVVRASERASWDVLVLDLSLPGLGGLEVIRRLRAERPSLRVLVFSMYPAEQYAARLLQEGAAGYLSKDQGPNDVVEAVRAIAAGRTWFSLDTVVRLREAGTESMPHERLSSREHQVFTRLVEGRSVSEIAAELGIGSSTVSNHVMKIREKLDVRTVGEIIRYAHRAGLLGTGTSST